MFKVFQLFRKKKKRVNKKQILFTTIVLGVISVAFFVSYSLSQESNIVVLDINLGSDNYDASTRAFYDRGGLSSSAISSADAVFIDGEYGKVNGAMDFRGGSKYIRVVGDSINGGSWAYPEASFVMWVRPSSTSSSADQNIVTIENSFEIAINNMGNGYSSVKYASNPWAWRASSGNYVKNDAWNQIVYVHSNTSRKMYVNGVNIYTSTETGYLSAGSASYPYLSIGGRYSGTSAPFDGLIQKVKIVNYALSDTEVSNLYRGGKSVASGTSLRKGLVGHWSMDQNTYVEGTENLVNISEWEAHGSSWVNSGDHYLGRDVFKNTVTNPDVGNNYGFRVVNKNISISKHNLTLSFYAKLIGDSGGMSGYAKVYYTDGTNQNHSWSYTPNIFSNFSTYQNKWTYVTATVNLNTSKTPNYISHIYVYKDFVSAGAEMDICCIQVEEKAKATPYTEGIRDGRLTDFSPYSNHGDTGIEQSFVFTEDRFGKEGGAMIFDGNYVEVSNSINQSSLEQEWTVSAWVNIQDKDDQYLVSGLNSGVKLIHGTTNRALLYLNSGANDYYIYSDLTNLLEGQGWKHVTFVFRNSDGLRKIYVNGEDHSGSGPNNTYTPKGISSLLRIGDGAKGSIDDVRIYNRALSESEIKSLYGKYSPKTTTGSLQKGLVLDMPLKSGYVKSEISGSEIMTDITPYSNHGQNYGATITDEGASFDGVNDFISLGTGNDFFPLNTFSVCSWVKSPGLASGMSNNGIFSMTYGLTMYLSSSGYFVSRMDSGVGLLATSVPINLHDDKYHQVCLSYDGTSRHMFVDGNLENSTITTWLGTTRWPSHTVNVGHENNNPSVTRFNGQISNILIYNRALSDEEVKMIYDRNRSDAGIIFQSQN